MAGRGGERGLVRGLDGGGTEGRPGFDGGGILRFGTKAALGAARCAGSARG